MFYFSNTDFNFVDWIDRGSHQVEVVALIFALKVAFPGRVVLVRGNHEFRVQNTGHNGFREKCNIHFGRLQGPTMFESIHSVFEWLPLSCLIENTVLVVHGGIGDGSWGLRELQSIDRPLIEWDTESLSCDVVWSDPLDGDEQGQRGVHGNPRDGNAGKIHCFTPETTAKFCRENNIQLIIRSHQYIPQGFKIMHGGHLITVFSARNYFQSETGESNDGAFILLAFDEERNLQCKPHKVNHRL